MLALPRLARDGVNTFSINCAALEAAPAATPPVPAPRIGGASLADARALMAVGAHARVAAAVDATLGGQLLLAEALAASGDPSGALGVLRDAVDEAEESAPAFLPAMLCGLRPTCSRTSVSP